MKGDTKMRKFYKSSLVIALLSVLLILQACGGGSDSSGSSDSGEDGDGDEVIKLGIISSTTGRGAAYGEAQNDGVNLALKEIEEAGGVDGFTLDVYQEDDESEPPTGVTVAKKLIDQNGVDVIVGSSSSLVTIAFMQENERNKVPLLNAMAGAPEITETGHEHVWRTLVTDIYLDVQAVEKLMDENDYKNFAFLAENSDYGVPPLDKASEKVEEKGGTVVAYEKYTPGDTDFKAQLSKIKAANPDVVFTHGYYTEGSIIARQIEELGIDAQLVVNMGQGLTTFADLAEGAEEGTIFPSSWLPDEENEMSKEFYDKFVAEYDREPGGFEAASYESIYMVIEAAKRGGGTTPEDIQKGLNELKGFETILGEVNFNEINQNETEITFGQFVDGEIEIYRTE